MRIIETGQFSVWLAGLKDIVGRRAIVKRLARLAANGHFGDVKRFDGLGEMRVFVGPGYRIYFVEREREIVILLVGGSKRTQERDIARAREIAAGLE